MTLENVKLLQNKYVLKDKLIKKKKKASDAFHGGFEPQFAIRNSTVKDMRYKTNPLSLSKDYYKDNFTLDQCFSLNMPVRYLYNKLNKTDYKGALKVSTLIVGAYPVLTIYVFFAALCVIGYNAAYGNQRDCFTSSKSEVDTFDLVCSPHLSRFIPRSFFEEMKKSQDSTFYHVCFDQGNNKCFINHLNGKLNYDDEEEE